MWFTTAPDAAASPIPRLPKISTSQGTMLGGDVPRNIPTIAVNTSSCTTPGFVRA